MNDRPKEILPAGEVRHDPRFWPLWPEVTSGHFVPKWGERTNAGTRRRNGAGTAFGGNGSKAKMEGRMSKKLPEIERPPGGGLPRMPRRSADGRTPLFGKPAATTITATACCWTMGRNVSVPRRFPIPSAASGSAGRCCHRTRRWRRRFSAAPA